MTYPSRYCILIGVEKPLSYSFWNNSFNLENHFLMLKLQVAAIDLVLRESNRATLTYVPIIALSIKVLHIDWGWKTIER